MRGEQGSSGIHVIDKWNKQERGKKERGKEGKF
jgi:hypothetical protein